MVVVEGLAEVMAVSVVAQEEVMDWAAEAYEAGCNGQMATVESSNCCGATAISFYFYFLPRNPLLPNQLQGVR